MVFPTISVCKDPSKEIDRDRDGERERETERERCAIDR